MQIISKIKPLKLLHESAPYVNEKKHQIAKNRKQNIGSDQIDIKLLSFDLVIIYITDRPTAKAFFVKRHEKLRLSIRRAGPSPAVERRNLCPVVAESAKFCFNFG